MFRAPRLVPSPVFLLSAPRSGSTLLRSMLDTHSRIHAPSELNLTEVGVRFLQFPAELGLQTVYTEVAFGEAGLTTDELEYLLWDRILHRGLQRSGKDVLVHKAPRLLLRWRRLAECWPEARYIFLLRHPMNVVLSSREATWGRLPELWTSMADSSMRYFYLLREARAELGGLTVRYEDLTEDPTEVCRKICEFLDVEWEPRMVNYGSVDHGPAVAGFGDMSANLASGRMRPGRPLPADEDIPLGVRPICEALGYTASRYETARAN